MKILEVRLEPTNLLLRREAPYPLGHTSHDALALRLAIMHTTWPTAETLLKKGLGAYNSSQHCSSELQASNLDVAWSHIQSSSPSPLLTKLLPPVLRPGAPSSCFLFILGHVACTTNLLEGRKQSDYTGSQDMVHRYASLTASMPLASTCCHCRKPHCH